MKAERNKTIDITVAEGQKYLKRCVSVSESVELSAILNKTVLGIPSLSSRCSRKNLWIY